MSFDMTSETDALKCLASKPNKMLNSLVQKLIFL